MDKLSEGTFLSWIAPEPGRKPRRIVLSPVNEDTIYVLMADHQGNLDVELFVARRADTGVGASQLVQESMEVVEDGDPELMTLLGQSGPNWWHISAHLDGEHTDQRDPDCLLCREDDDSAPA